MIVPKPTAEAEWKGTGSGVSHLFDSEPSVKIKYSICGMKRLPDEPQPAGTHCKLCQRSEKYFFIRKETKP